MISLNKLRYFPVKDDHIWFGKNSFVLQLVKMCSHRFENIILMFQKLIVNCPMSCRAMLEVECRIKFFNFFFQVLNPVIIDEISDVQLLTNFFC